MGLSTLSRCRVGLNWRARHPNLSSTSATMRVVLALAPALVGVVAAFVSPMGAGLLSPLAKREELETCSGLTISENNGDRKGEILSELMGFPTKLH